MDLHVNQKVICVKRDWSGHPGYRFNMPMPVFGQIYTIAGFRSNEYTDCLMLGELKPRVQWFTRKGFRPLNEEGMSQLRALLTPAPPKLLV